MYSSSQLKKLYEDNSHRFNSRVAQPLFEEAKDFNQAGPNNRFHYAEEDRRSNVLINPDIWSELMPLEDFELDEIPADDSLSGILDSVDLFNNLDLDAASSQDSNVTIPMECNANVKAAIELDEAPLADNKVKLVKSKTRKVRKHPVPDVMKDERYWNRRVKNNEAAKKSRDAKRMKDDEIGVRANYLEATNDMLKLEISRLSAENSLLRNRLSKYEGSKAYSTPASSSSNPCNLVGADHGLFKQREGQHKKRAVNPPSYFNTYVME